MYNENLSKNGPLFREFWTLIPTHMGGTYPRILNVLCSLPPGRKHPNLGKHALPRNFFHEAKGLGTSETKMALFVIIANLRDVPPVHQFPRLSRL